MDGIRSSELVEQHNAQQWLRAKKVFGQRNASLVAWCTADIEREQRIQQARFEREFAEQFRHLTFPLPQLERASLVVPLKRWLAEQPKSEKPTLVHLPGMEKLGERLPEFIKELNFQREQLFRGLGASLLFWSDEATQIRAQIEAPDFWDWLAYRFHFETFFVPVFQNKDLPERENQKPKDLARLKNRLATLESLKTRNSNYALEWATIAKELAENLPADCAHEAKNLLRECLQIFEKEGKQFDFAETWCSLGDIAKAVGNLPEARSFFEKYLETCERLAAENAGVEKFEREFAVSNSRLGDLALALGQPAEAKRFFEKYMEISERLAAANPDSEEIQREWAVSNSRLGDLALALGQPAEAKRFFEKDMEISERLAAANPDSEEIQRGWAVSNSRLGDLARALGQPAEAKRFFEKYMEISERLAAANPDSEQIQRDWAVSNSKMGDLALALGQPAEAKRFFEKYMEISERLAAANPDSEEIQRGWAVSNSRLGDLARALGQPAEAKRFFEKDMEISERLAAANPDSEQIQCDWAVSLANMGILEIESGGDKNRARAHFEKSLEIVEARLVINPLSADLKELAETVRGWLAGL